jgi:hypothetical protein
MTGFSKILKNISSSLFAPSGFCLVSEITASDSSARSSSLSAERSYSRRFSFGFAGAGFLLVAGQTCLTTWITRSGLLV